VIFHIDLEESDFETIKVAAAILKRISGRYGKVKNAHASVAKAKARGSFLGRRKKRDDVAIGKLRAKGMSIRAIAKATNVSTTAVQRSLKGAKP
jgi:hypothetical protein